MCVWWGVLGMGLGGGQEAGSQLGPLSLAPVRFGVLCSLVLWLRQLGPATPPESWWRELSAAPHRISPGGLATAVSPEDTTLLVAGSALASMLPSTSQRGGWGSDEIWVGG